MVGPAPVPPNATVIFEVELYSVSRGPRTLEAFKEMDQDQDDSLTEVEVIMIFTDIIITTKTRQTFPQLLEQSHYIIIIIIVIVVIQ